MAKYSGTGTYQFWGLRIGGADEDQFSDVFIDSENNLFISGTFSNVVDFDPSFRIVNRTSNGLWDGFIAKYRPSQGFDFVKTMGGVGIDEVRGLEVTSNGKLIFCTGEASIPHIGFNGELIHRGGFYLARYEE